MAPPPYKASFLARGRAATEARLNAPPYTSHQGPYFKVRFSHVHELADGSLWDHFDVLKADKDALSGAWKEYAQHEKNVVDPVTFYVLVPHTAYLEGAWLPMSSDLACLMESVAIGVAGAAFLLWGVWGVLT